MSDTAIYYFAWIVYLLAGGVFYALFWKLTQSSPRLYIVYCSRAVLFALMATPWYAGKEGVEMAPALMVVLMDAITISGAAAVRAFVPLFLAVLISIAVGVGLAVIHGRAKRAAGKPLV